MVEQKKKGLLPVALNWIMTGWFRQQIDSVYEGLLEREISGTPGHVAVIQDGNRRYARSNGGTAIDGHRAGAKTAERILGWCQDLRIEELTLYTFSTENFSRSSEENEALFDLICEKFRKFADHDRVHDNEVAIRAVGETDMLPQRVQKAINYAESRTANYDRFKLNIALAYGGRTELLNAAQAIGCAVNEGDINPHDIDVETIEKYLYDGPSYDVDLIIRPGGEERTSNFLPWHANGNEAAVYFCTAYWPEFRKIDFLRAIRTYESREQSWRRTRVRRALALIRAVGGAELSEAHAIIEQFRDSLPQSELEDFSEGEERSPAADD